MGLIIVVILFLLFYKAVVYVEEMKKERWEAEYERQRELSRYRFTKSHRAKMAFERNQPYTDPDTGITYKGKEIQEFREHGIYPKV